MKNFRYSLTGLQRVQEYQLDQLAIELTEMRDKLMLQRDKVQGFEEQINIQEKELSSLVTRQPLFWIESRELMISYLADLREKRMKELLVLEELTISMSQLMAKIIEARKASALLDKHKARSQQNYLLNENRKHSQLIDELVLRRVATI